MSEQNIMIYGRENLHDLPWPKTDWSKKVREFIVPLVESGPAHFINNISINMELLTIGDLVLPLAVCEPGHENSYVCSPYSHYVTYGKDEVQKIGSPLLRGILGGLISLLGVVLSSCEIDKNVYVNNWLVPTNLYPAIKDEEIRAITDKLSRRYPDHAILFRSVSPGLTRLLYNSLQMKGYRFVIGRSIYYTDAKDEHPFKSRMFKSDLKVLSTSQYKTTEDPRVLEESVSRIKDLYSLLNIIKYSKCNPQFNDNFVRLAINSGFLKMKAFESAQKIDAVYGYFEYDGMMTSPFFGYDTSKPPELGLYRLISTELLQDAKEKQMLLHQSSGAGNYKKLRRAQELLEFTAVYDKHLSSKRRLAWKLLELMMATFGKKFIKDYE